MQDNNGRPAKEPESRWRWVVFGALALLVLVSSCDIPGLAGVGDPKESREVVDASVRAAWMAADSSARAYLEAEHQAILAEIQHRLELEHLLFALKFVLVGGTLYLLFQQAFSASSARFARNKFTALISWAAVVAAAIVDLRLAANMTFITTLGGWVRRYETLRLGQGGVVLGWEAFLADNLLGKPYYPALRISSQILTALLFCTMAAMFLLSSGRLLRPSRLVACCGAMLSIVLMTAASLSLRQDPLSMGIHLGIGAAALVLLMMLGFWNPKSGRKAPAHHRKGATDGGEGPDARPSPPSHAEAPSS